MHVHKVVESVTEQTGCIHPLHTLARAIDSHLYTSGRNFLDSFSKLRILEAFILGDCITNCANRLDPPESFFYGF